MSAIAIAKAWVCAGCSCVFDGPVICPQCASSAAVIPLSRWIKPLDGPVGEVVRALTNVSAVGGRER